MADGRSERCDKGYRTFRSGLWQVGSGFVFLFPATHPRRSLPAAAPLPARRPRNGKGACRDRRFAATSARTGTIAHRMQAAPPPPTRPAGREGAERSRAGGGKSIKTGGGKSKQIEPTFNLAPSPTWMESCKMMPWASLGLLRNAALVFLNAHHPPPPERRVASLLPANRIGERRGAGRVAR